MRTIIRLQSKSLHRPALPRSAPFRPRQEALQGTLERADSVDAAKALEGQKPRLQRHSAPPRIVPENPPHQIKQASPPRFEPGCIAAIVPGAEGMASSAALALGVGVFFIPHLPAVGAGFICAATMAAAAGLCWDARERVTWLRGISFTHRHFTFLRIDPPEVDNATLQAHYAKQVAGGGYSGFVEIDALGQLTGTHIDVYDLDPNLRKLPRAGRWRRLASMGLPADEATPTVTLAHPRMGHYRALIKHRVGDGAWLWRDIECGGGGDCLFHATRYGLQRLGLSAGNASAATLRALTARRIASDPAFADDRIRNQTYNAWAEYQQAHAFARDRTC